MSQGQAGGSRHWRNQRLTSIALLPLGLWFLFALLGLPDLSHATVMRWLAEPLPGLLAALFVLVALWHSAQGWRVVLEDYVGGKLLPRSLLISRLLHVATAIATIWSVIVIMTGQA